MERIESFKIDHMRLVPGIYVSRVDNVGEIPVTTYDIRLKRPNFEEAMTPEIAHTLEHLSAVFLRNHPVHKDNIIYVGPMGCLTGLYLIYKGQHEFKDIVKLVLAMMTFIVRYDDTLEAVGFDAESCGNYTLNDLQGAQTVAANFLVLDDTFKALKFEYPTVENSPEIMTSTHVNGDDRLNKDLKRARTMRHPVEPDYPSLNIEVKSELTTEETVLEQSNGTSEESSNNDPDEFQKDMQEIGDYIEQLEKKATEKEFERVAKLNSAKKTSAKTKTSKKKPVIDQNELF